MTSGTPGVFQETTISERWNAYISGLNGGYAGAASSFNHYALGAVGEWIYRIVGGITPDDANPGYRNVILNPRPGGGITNAFASLNSIRGQLTVYWTNDIPSSLFRLNVTNSANTTTSVYLPTTNLVDITESGGSGTKAVGVLSYQVTNGATIFRVGSGGYSLIITNPTFNP